MKTSQNKKRRNQSNKKPLGMLIKELNTEGRLALFMGAGISMNCGLPSWEELIKRVLDKIWKRKPDFATFLMGQQKLHAARFARQIGKDNFNQIVHSAIYQSENVKISECLKAIANSGIKQICNFNFDDLLEEAIKTYADSELISVSHNEKHLAKLTQ